MPIVAVNQEKSIAEPVAENFFYSKLYLQAFGVNFEIQLNSFKNVMKNSNINPGSQVASKMIPYNIFTN